MRGESWTKFVFPPIYTFEQALIALKNENIFFHHIIHAVTDALFFTYERIFMKGAQIFSRE
jgi:hypothetical protein